jgi:hypothetical protein
MTVNSYLEQLTTDRVEPMMKLRQAILDHLPKGFEECINYGMLSFVVPHSIYPAGYHCDPKLPLPFMALASQKSHIGFYHMGIYASTELMEWFQAEYTKVCKFKLDMGKSCIRFKKMDDIPYELIGKLVAKISVQDWIASYENNLKR